MAAKKQTTKKPDFPRDEIGLIDWKSLIPKKFIDLSTEWCAANGVDKTTLSRDDIEEKLETVPDEAKVILLPGFKAIAKLRGLKAIHSDVKHVEHNYVTVVCLLEFTDMDGEVSHSTGIANATNENTSYPFNMYLEAMAENRAFIRAVRNALNINIVGYEELKGNSPQISSELDEFESALSPQATLRKIIENKGKTFGDLKATLKKNGYDGEYESFEDVPPEICLEIIAKIQKRANK